jgi:hypothetical protein
MGYRHCQCHRDCDTLTPHRTGHFLVLSGTASDLCWSQPQLRSCRYWGKDRYVLIEDQGAIMYLSDIGQSDQTSPGSNSGSLISDPGHT